MRLNSFLCSILCECECVTNLWPFLSGSWSVGRSAGCLTVWHSSLKGREVTLPCSYQSTCLFRAWRGIRQRERVLPDLRIHQPPVQVVSFYFFMCRRVWEGASSSPSDQDYKISEVKPREDSKGMRLQKDSKGIAEDDIRQPSVCDLFDSRLKQTIYTKSANSVA